MININLNGSAINIVFENKYIIINSSDVKFEVYKDIETLIFTEDHKPIFTLNFDQIKINDTDVTVDNVDDLLSDLFKEGGSTPITTPWGSLVGSITDQTDLVAYIAEAKATALVFDDEAQLNDWIAGTYVRPDGKTIDDLIIGNLFLLRSTDEPDYWWDGSAAQILETKIDISEFTPITWDTDRLRVDQAYVTDFKTRVKLNDILKWSATLNSAINSISMNAGNLNIFSVVGNQLYSVFVSSGATVATISINTWNATSIPIAASMKVFIDMWNEAAGSYGTYNSTNNTFELNGHIGLTYAQALEIYNCTANKDILDYSTGHTFSPNIVTNLPLTYGSNTAVPYSIAQSCGNMTKLETLNLQSVYNPSFTFGRISNIHLFTYLSSKLRKILGTITVTDNFETGQVFNNRTIEDVNLNFSLFNTSVAKTLDLSRLPLSLSSLTYFITNFRSGNTGTFTVSLNSLTYDKLTPTLLTDATAKNISFVIV